jgi:hypothetical protein
LVKPVAMAAVPNSSLISAQSFKTMRSLCVGGLPTGLRGDVFFCFLIVTAQDTPSILRIPVKSFAYHLFSCTLISMMITMAVAAFMLAAGNAQARLGWTIDDCQNMWGAPTKVQLVPALNKTCFTFPAQSNLFVQVYLLDDMVQDINYVSRSKAFLLKNANQFLQTNVSGLWNVYDDGRGVMGRN